MDYKHVQSKDYFFNYIFMIYVLHTIIWAQKNSAHFYHPAFQEKKTSICTYQKEQVWKSNFDNFISIKKVVFSIILFFLFDCAPKKCGYARAVDR